MRRSNVLTGIIPMRRLEMPALGDMVTTGRRRREEADSGPSGEWIAVAARLKASDLAAILARQMHDWEIRVVEKKGNRFIRRQREKRGEEPT